MHVQILYQLIRHPEIGKGVHNKCCMMIFEFKAGSIYKPCSAKYGYGAQ